MFQSTQHLPQRLSREHYVSPEIYQRELERIFLPGWHCIGVLPDAPHIGDFFTFELFGTPLVCWHTSEKFQTFLNVCTHRFCTLTDKPRGRFGERIKCQYHGWEYDEAGNTCKIPDAQHFRPLKKGELGLREYRTEMVGQLIFVTMNEGAVSVEEFLGPQLVAWCRRYFSPQHRLTHKSDLYLSCNWKVVVENVLEAYHLACVHTKSFRGYPNPERCQHEFHATHDYYRHDSSDVVWGSRMERLVARLSGREPELYWEHILRYPNVILGGTGPWHYLQMVIPTGPETCRSVSYNMHYSGPKGQLWPFLLHRMLKRAGSIGAAVIQSEDAVIYPSIHRGTASEQRPHGGGLISAREERIFTFQDYVLNLLKPEPIATRPQTPAAYNGLNSLPPIPELEASRN